MASLAVDSWEQPSVPALPLPETGWGEEQARRALVAAVPRLGRDLVPPEQAELVSVLTTVVLRAGDWAVKVYPPGTDPDHLDRVNVALEGSRTAHLGVGCPVSTAYGVVTLAPWLAGAEPASWSEVGRLLAEFHHDHAEAQVPRWEPVSRLESQVRDLPHAASVLLDARAMLLDRLADLRSPLGHGVIHGDVSPSNVLHTPAGPRLIDLDWVAVAPREYDLAAAARRVRAGEITSATYAEFCDGYGYDVLGWPGLDVLDRVADLGGVAFRLWDDRQHGRTSDWLPAELEIWRARLAGDA